MDADVIKTYVELGMGVGIVAAIAYDEARDRDLRAIDARHLFAANMTRLGGAARHVPARLRLRLHRNLRVAADAFGGRAGAAIDHRRRQLRNLMPAAGGAHCHLPPPPVHTCHASAPSPPARCRRFRVAADHAVRRRRRHLADQAGAHRRAVRRRAAPPTSWRARSRPSCSKAFGQPFIVDNRPGAGGNIGADRWSPSRRPTATRC